MSNPDLQPEGSHDLFHRLGFYDNQAKIISEEVRKAKDFIRQSNDKMQQSIGSITTVSEIIASSLDPNLIEQWCLAYESKSGEAPVSKPAAEKTIDMAGSTAKTLPPIETK